MEPNERRSVGRCMRALHRDVGFFVVGLVVVYALSGMVLVYRDVGFMTFDAQVETNLDPGVAPADLGRLLRMKDFKVLKTEGDMVYFQGGSYNTLTGDAVYSTKKMPAFLQRCVDLHKTVSGRPTHWCAMLFAGLMCFLAISSFWMYNPGTGAFRRGVCITLAGVVATAVVILVL